MGVNVPLPFSALAGAVRNAYGYFRTPVRVEGSAILCEAEHLGVWGGLDRELATKPQHIDVEARFWSRRGRVSVLEVSEARILSRAEPLAVAAWDFFKPVTLEEGGPDEKREFTIVPRGDPKRRVEAAVGEVLVVEFRPSRGSERFARPRLEVPLGMRH